MSPVANSHRPGRLLRLAGLAALIGIAWLVSFGASPASAFVYWSDAGSAITRANLDGTGVDRGFLTPPQDSAPIRGIAVDDTYVYYAAGDDIVRAKLDGSGLDPDFIADIDPPNGIAVNDNHIYWVSGGGIGRAGIDGTDVDEAFIRGNGEDMAIDGAHIYWTNDGYDLSHISRAELDGTDVEADFIQVPGGVLTNVAVGDNHVYWTSQNDLTNAIEDPATISRAALDGTSVEQRFIDGLDAPGNLAVDANHIYWAVGLREGGDATFSISRANLAGGEVESKFIPGAYAGDLAVDPLTSGPPPPPVAPNTRIDDFYVKRHKRHSRKSRVGFTFSSTQPDWTFRCRIDQRKFKACLPPQSYRKLGRGRHVFEVAAVNRDGVVDPTPARKRFRF